MKNAILKTLVLVLVAAALGLGSIASAQTVPLASWKDGAAKQSIISFVKKVTKPGSPNFVPTAERIAVFDKESGFSGYFGVGAGAASVKYIDFYTSEALTTAAGLMINF
jgi:hypothetical protein